MEPIIINNSINDDLNKTPNNETPDEVYGPSGLENLGNTCFMNSIIQCLSNTIPFKEYLYHVEFAQRLIENIRSTMPEYKKNIVSAIENEFNNNKLTYQLHRIFKSLWNSYNCKFNPTSFYNMFQQKFEMFRGSQQQDSSEALYCILQTIHEELTQKKNINFDNNDNNIVTYEKLQNKLNDEICINNPDEKMKIIEQMHNLELLNPAIQTIIKSRKSIVNCYSDDSVISRLFQGLNCDTILCPSCSYETRSFSSFLLLNLHIPEKNTENIIEKPTQKYVDTQKYKYGVRWNYNQYKWEHYEITHDVKNKLDQLDNIIHNTNCNSVISSNSDDQNDFTDVDMYDYKTDIIDTPNVNIVNSIYPNLDDTIYTIDDCLNKYIEIDKLDDQNKWLCPNCNTKVNGEKHTSVWITPKILIIQLMRFIKTPNKIYKKRNLINFPITGLDISKLIDPLNNNKQYTYDLFAINNHLSFGNSWFSTGTNCGHYYSYCKNHMNGKWYELNDSRVEEIGEDKLITPNAYILFYIRNN